MPFDFLGNELLHFFPIGILIVAKVEVHI